MLDDFRAQLKHAMWAKICWTEKCERVRGFQRVMR